MDDFFKKRLSDLNEADDRWNIPSNQVWENVVPHLPKPKKKRRRFILFFIGVGLLASTGFIYTYLFDQFSDHAQENIVLEKRKIQTSDKATRQSNSTHTSEINHELNFTNNNILKKEVESNSNTKEHQIVRAQKLITGSETIKAQKSAVSSTEAKKEISDLDNTLESNDRLVNSDFAGQPSTIIDSRYIQRQKQVQNIDHNQLGENSNLTATMNVQNITSLSSLTTLPTLPMASNKNKDMAKFLPSLAILKTNFTPIRLKDEIGISHGFSVFSFLDELKEDELGDQLSIIPKYQNINLHYNRVIGKRWRFSTGAFMSKLDMHMAFDGSFVYESILSSRSIISEYDDTVQQSSANGAGNVTINFINGQEPKEAETLNIRGAVDVELRALQIPIFFTHHWVKNRWGFFVGGGPTFELLSERQINAGFTVFRGEEIISSAVDIQDYYGIYTDISIYGVTGMKYHINNHINLGLNLKVNIPDPIFTTLDVGMFYRW